VATNYFNERYYVTEDTEAQLLAGLIIDACTLTRDSIIDVAKILQPSDFQNTDHQRIFTAMLSCEHAISYVAIAKELDRTKTLATGDLKYLVHLVSRCYCSPFDLVYYAKLVKEYSDQRKGKSHPVVRGAL